MQHSNTQTSTALTTESKGHSLSLSKGAHRRRYRHLPFMRRPNTMEDKDGVEPWLEEEAQATEWLSLFYDLVVVAVLTVFSSNAELASPGAIPIFFSYFTVISWIWSSQVAYDIRYQAEDAWHRHMKGAQVAIFVFIGASSGGWNPGLIRDPASDPGISGKSATDHDAARQSFSTVLIAYAISRGILAIQYLVTAYLGHHANRKVTGHLTSVATLAVSIVFTIVAVTLRAHSDGGVIAKIVLFYLAVAIEVVGMWIQMRHKLHQHIHPAKIADRYGAFSLIILGEGFISLTRAFSAAISGLSESSSATYLQVFLGIAIIYMLWNFMFSQFRKEDEIDQRRALIWEGLHFPLHFGLLLLLASIVNTTIVISFSHGVELVSNEFIRTIDSLNNASELSAGDQVFITQYLNKLILEPSYEEEYAYLLRLSQQPDPPEDPGIVASQYFGLIITQTCVSYGVEIGENTLAALERLYAVNATNPEDDAITEQRRDEATKAVAEVLQYPVDEALSGVLWLFPTAGCVLILIAFRSMLWYRYTGIAHYVVHGSMILFGLALALLGLLDLGPREVSFLSQTENNTTAGSDKVTDSLNPMYRLLSTRYPLLVIWLTYFGVYMGSIAVLGFVHRRKGGVWDEDVGGEEKKLGGGEQVDDRGDE